MGKEIQSLIEAKSPLLMGILNTTPDSFSDGGEFFNPKKAISHAIQMQSEGADIIDIGGESTGPGSQEVKEKEELERVIPVVSQLSKQLAIPISVDTYKSAIAERALGEGATFINDVTALRQDPDLAKLIAAKKCPVVMMYSKDNSPRTTVEPKEYEDVIKTIINFFDERIDYAKKQGISMEQIIIDPGMGQFISSIPKYSYEILARLSELKTFGLSILVGTSRKSFLGGKMESREEKGLTADAIAIMNGASILRVHEVGRSREFINSLNK